jgi:hypothetical protein
MLNEVNRKSEVLKEELLLTQKVGVINLGRHI